jgi:hypothetical protein
MAALVPVLAGPCWQNRTGGDRQLVSRGQELGQPGNALFQVGVTERTRQPEVAVSPERLARYHRHVGLVQQQLCELAGGGRPLAPSGSGQTTPGTSFSIAVISCRRRSNADRIRATADKSPDTAVSAAAWATLQTLDVACDCKLIAALMTSAGPAIQPTRQPVIAYVFATPFRTRQRSAISGATTGIETNRASP